MQNGEPHTVEAACGSAVRLGSADLIVVGTTIAKVATNLVAKAVRGGTTAKSLARPRGERLESAHRLGVATAIAELDTGSVAPTATRRVAAGSFAAVGAAQIANGLCVRATVSERDTGGVTKAVSRRFAAQSFARAGARSRLVTA